MSTAPAARSQPAYPADPPNTERKARTGNRPSRSQGKSQCTSPTIDERCRRELGRSSAAIKPDDEGVFQTTGTVTAIADDVIEVLASDETFRASCAVSCLVAPEEGDLVLLAGSRATSFYLLAVLERPGSHNTCISTDGDLTFELRTGRFTVAATEGVELVSKRTVSVTADRLEARAREGGLFLSTVRLIAGAVDSILERLSQRVKRVYRRVEELEHVRAGQIDCAAEGNLRLHGENTLVTANQLVKADAKQIHIG
ncbi:MAG: DUF3540 domain-containing protein [Planctomycetota bacterium]|jgi:hypothetical protein